MFTKTNNSIKSSKLEIYRKLVIVLVGAAILLSFAPHSADADVTVTWSDDGTDLTANVSGIFDLSPYTFTGSFSGGAPEARSYGGRAYFYGMSGNWDYYDTGSDNLGAGHFIHGDVTGVSSLSGDTFGFHTSSPSRVYFSSGYISNSAINRSITWSNATVSSIFGSGLDSPAVFYDDGTNQVTYATSAVAVPEPTTFGLIGLASLGLGLTRRRRS